MRPFVVLAVAALLTGCAAQNDLLKDAAAVIDAPTFTGHVRTLASDEFEGRKPASNGEKRTVEYLEQQFTTLSMRPANGASFRQTVPLVEITTAQDAHLAVAGPAGRIDLRYGDDMMIWTKHVQPSASIADSPMVFVGYGIVAPEYGWNDYAGVDMRGKTAVILVNDPGFVTGDPALFKGRAMTYHGRWTYKFEEAARQGASGAIIIHETEAAAYPWDVVRTSWSGPQFDRESADGNASRAAIEGWITFDSAKRVFGLAGLDLDALKAAAVQRGFRPVPMNLGATAGVRNLVRRARSSNVAAMIEGHERPDEYVVFMAHWDHLGRALAFSGDSIYNGAVDNATGLAALLSIARAFRELSPPRRSVVFLAVTAEEDGTIGSEYYAENPIVPLEKTAAVINMDGFYPWGRAKDIEVVGFGASDLEDLLAAVVSRHDRVVSPDPVPEKGFFYRSDHFGLARKGVPALYVKSGSDLLVGGRAAGRAWLEDYYARRYHKPDDEYSDSWDVSGCLEDVRLLFEVGSLIASGAFWPNWYPGNEFRAARDASAAARR